MTSLSSHFHQITVKFKGEMGQLLEHKNRKCAARCPMDLIWRSAGENRPNLSGTALDKLGCEGRRPADEDEGERTRQEIQSLFFLNTFIIISPRWLVFVLPSIGLSRESGTEDDKISTDQSRSPQTHSTSMWGGGLTDLWAVKRRRRNCLPTSSSGLSGLT